VNNEGFMSNQKAMMPYAFFRNEVVPFQNATISIASHSLQYGTSCFGGIRGYFHAGKVKVFRLKDHYERLTNSPYALRAVFGLSQSSSGVE
jgi:branched-chain amino acid aminotransferase